MKFVKVLNPILSITSGMVKFDCEVYKNGRRDRKNETSLRRVHDKKVIWKLKEDGIYVRREYAEAYRLIIDPEV